MYHVALMLLELVSFVLLCRGQQQILPNAGFELVTQGDQPHRLFPRQSPPSSAPYNNLSQPIQHDESFRPDESGPGPHLPDRPPAAINDRCTQDRECAVEDTYCKDGMFCSCRGGKVPSNDCTRCLPIAKKLNDSCEEDMQCTENLQMGAQCKAGTCQCREHHHYAELQGQNGCYTTKSETAYRDMNNGAANPFNSFSQKYSSPPFLAWILFITIG